MCVCVPVYGLHVFFDVKSFKEIVIIIHCLFNKLVRYVCQLVSVCNCIAEDYFYVT